MDRQKLKNLLHEQSSPFDEAVQKKLDYLMSDDVFSLENNPYANSFRNIQIDDEDEFSHAFSDDDSSFDEAFDDEYEDEDEDGYEDVDEDVDEDDYGDEEDGEVSQAAAPKTLAERIAMLRGVSTLPGSYLNKKN